MSTFEPIYGKTERLFLRQFSEQDIDPFYSYRSNPVVAEFQPWGKYQYDDAVSFVRRQITNVPGQPGTWFQFAIALVETDQFIGDCALHTLLDEPRIVEIGFTLAEEHQGKGYASEAVKLLLTFVFEQLNKHKVIAFTDVRNESSIRLLERVGMRREGHLLENYFSNGQWVNEYQYSILQSEWII
ncbi:GNAT family N-acetyltransferase [Paenibacillus sp. NFR01]|uniref:GNAT family N-acetyltransferase n=1 Tax=Paenibacillus sp. NFR01 TaxID=1566279 RepID=UPI0008CEFA71|nr:GNAT family protein [Paenibacillus sp. NFR01]SET26891.1 Protein N-acetyltransferase, RimJ/RimL family [Paenibacillus sp. NFR01]